MGGTYFDRYDWLSRRHAQFRLPKARLVWAFMKLYQNAHFIVRISAEIIWGIIYIWSYSKNRAYLFWKWPAFALGRKLSLLNIRKRWERKKISWRIFQNHMKSIKHVMFVKGWVRFCLLFCQLFVYIILFTFSAAGSTRK